MTRGLGERREDRRCRGRGRAVASLVTLIGLALSVSAGASTAYAAPGDLDGSFSHDGRVLTDIAGGDDTATAVAIQPDGKSSPRVSHRRPGRARRFALARYDPDGARDLSFGSQGIVTTRFGDRARPKRSRSSQTARSWSPALANRPERDGASPSPGTTPTAPSTTSFNGDGRLTTTIPTTAPMGPSALALQPDGRILVDAGGVEGKLRVRPATSPMGTSTRLLVATGASHGISPASATGPTRSPCSLTESRSWPATPPESQASLVDRVIAVPAPTPTAISIRASGATAEGPP